MWLFWSLFANLNNSEFKPSLRKRALALFLPISCLLVLAALAFYPVTALFVSVLSPVNEESESIIFLLKQNEEFTLSYTHSVDLLPVYEVYYRQGESIFLKETWFYNFGAGMGHLAGRGVYEELEEGLLKISGIDEEIGSFLLRTGLIADQTLHYCDEVYKLATIYGEDARLLFEIKKMPLYRTLIAVKAK